MREKARLTRFEAFWPKPAALSSPRTGGVGEGWGEGMNGLTPGEQVDFSGALKNQEDAYLSVVASAFQDSPPLDGCTPPMGKAREGGVLCLGVGAGSMV